MPVIPPASAADSAETKRDHHWPSPPRRDARRSRSARAPPRDRRARAAPSSGGADDAFSWCRLVWEWRDRRDVSWLSLVADDSVMQGREVEDLTGAGRGLQHAEQRGRAVEMDDPHRRDMVAQRLLLVRGRDVASRWIDRKHGRGDLPEREPRI